MENIQIAHIINLPCHADEVKCFTTNSCEIILLMQSGDKVVKWSNNCKKSVIDLQRNYDVICFDCFKKCYWAMAESNSCLIFCLDMCFQEVGSINICENCNHGLVSMTCDENDIKIMFSSQLAIISKNNNQVTFLKGNECFNNMGECNVNVCNDSERQIIEVVSPCGELAEICIPKQNTLLYIIPCNLCDKCNGCKGSDNCSLCKGSDKCNDGKACDKAEESKESDKCNACKKNHECCFYGLLADNCTKKICVVCYSVTFVIDRQGKRCFDLLKCCRSCSEQCCEKTHCKCEKCKCDCDCCCNGGQNSDAEAVCDCEDCCHHPHPKKCGAYEIIHSIALEEAGIAHILNAEGEKIQKAVALSKNIEELICVNQSVKRTLTQISILEGHLYAKLEAVLCGSCDKCKDCCDDCCKCDCDCDNDCDNFDCCDNKG